MSKLNRGLSAWQLTMLALGTVIGGSFFLGSSVAIQAAGPSILISYILGGILVYFILSALSELTVANPQEGSFRTYASQAFGNGAGFVVGWVYWTGMVLAMSSEATAVSILIREWMPDISIAFLGTIIIISVTLINLLGADKLSKLESGLAAIKILAIISFIILALLLILGLFPGTKAVGVGELVKEPLVPRGIKGFAGSMLIVMFAYAGFEIIGLAAAEAEDSEKTIPKAIKSTVFSLVAFYIISVAVMLPLIPTGVLTENVSPMVAALNRWGVSWAGTGINLVLITAILSTMLAAMFGLGRMMKSLANEGLAPKWLKDRSKVPKRVILFSGTAMLVGLGFGMLVPKIYLFLVSSGGFALLFTYAVIMATHIRMRKINEGMYNDKIKVKKVPYTSWIVLLCMIAIIISMPFIAGQGAGLVAGFGIVIFYMLVYFLVEAVKYNQRKEIGFTNVYRRKRFQMGLSTEFSKEITNSNKEEDRDKTK